MSIERQECHQRLIGRIIEDATHKPVQIRHASGWDRARADAPYYLGWLPTELCNKATHPRNFITVDGGLSLPSFTQSTDRKAMFCYVDDLLAMRLVSRAFAYKYKSPACVHALRRMMHTKPYHSQGTRWMFAMHCAALLMNRVATSVEEQGSLALHILKSVVVAHMVQGMPVENVQPMLTEITAHAPAWIPRFS